MAKDNHTQQIRSLPKVDETIEGQVLEIGRNEIYLDLDGLTTGIVRGPELFDLSKKGEFSDLKVGDKVNAIVIDEENEKGLVELSFRKASQKKIWKNLRELEEKGKKVTVPAIHANRGGLIVQYGKVQGFLPASQLSPEHYPHVEEGDKNKILEELKRMIGQKFEVKVINADPEEEKLIVSEKAAIKEKDYPVLEKYKVGDTVEGTVTGLVDFGVFVTFDKNQEGLVHISELAWKRLDHPRDIINIGNKVKAKIIGITEDGKVSLSIRRLIPDPWHDVEEKYHVGDIVEGKVLKARPFGLFVALDPKIHGLAHISELSDKPIKDISEIAKAGDKMKFKVVSIEPEDHRLGLSLKTLEKKESDVEEKKEEKKKKKPSKKK